MNDTLWVAILTLVGTLAGPFGGILTSSKLTGYRIEQLEKKMDEHNSTETRLTERVFKLEEHASVVDEQIKVANHRIDDLEKSEERRANDGK